MDKGEDVSFASFFTIGLIHFSEPDKKARRLLALLEKTRELDQDLYS